MRIKKVIIIAATLASAVPCIAGPFDLPRYYPPASINWQLQQFQADNGRRLMEEAMRQQRERDEHLLQESQQFERKDKEALKNLPQSGQP
jgi:hypothetical protein